MKMHNQPYSSDLAFSILVPSDAREARYTLWACVGLSVCLTKVGVLLKRLNLNHPNDAQGL